MQDTRLGECTVVITGGASGIGRATAVLFAEHGAKVFVGDVRLDPQVESELKELGIAAQRCDVRRESDVQSLIDSAVDQTGRIDVLVNNAGIGMVKPITEVTEGEWNACIDTNLKGAFFGSKHAIRHMQKAGGGVIVNTASNAGLLPRAHDPVYSISKHAMVALTKSLALCHGKDRIRVNAVCPGPVGDTGMMNADIEAAPDPEALRQQMIGASPLARAYERMIAPEEVAAAILYLASDAATMVTEPPSPSTAENRWACLPSRSAVQRVVSDRPDKQRTLPCERGSSSYSRTKSSLIAKNYAVLRLIEYIDEDAGTRNGGDAGIPVGCHSRVWSVFPSPRQAQMSRQSLCLVAAGNRAG